MEVSILTPSELTALAASGTPILGVVGFSIERPLGLPASCAFLGLPLPALSARRVEVWTGTRPVIRQDRNGLMLARSGGLLFGIAVAREADHAGLADLARSLYERIFEALAAAGCPTLLRVFNYLPGITADDAQDGGRYQAFNRGRHAAFAAASRPVAGAPATSALGLPAGVPPQDAGGAVSVYFLASDGAATPVENARQVSAYAYPPRYGPKSPIFSRATIAHPPDGPPREAQLFVSGTASIVGHESLHAGDPAAQTDEILRNFDALLATCRDRGLAPAGTLRLKAYLRQPADREAVAGRLHAAGLEAVFLQAEICRQDLLVEIEAAVRLRTARPDDPWPGRGREKGGTAGRHDEPSGDAG